VLAETAEDADAKLKERNGGRQPANRIPDDVIRWVAEFFSTSSRWVKLTAEEVKEVVVRCDLDPKSGLLSAEASVEAKSGAALAKLFAGLNS